MGKKVIITAELVDESLTCANSTINEDLVKWFRDESVPAPWIKEIKTIVVKRS
jgi:hypothetical protein